MEEISEQTENMKHIQDALSALIGASADFDEDELEEWKEQGWKFKYWSLYLAMMPSGAAPRQHVTSWPC